MVSCLDAGAGLFFSHNSVNTVNNVALYEYLVKPCSSRRRKDSFQPTGGSGIFQSVAKQRSQ